MHGSIRRFRGGAVGQRYRLLLLLSIVYLAVSLGLRLVLWWRFGAAAEVAVLQLPAVLLAGVMNDAVELLYLMLPLSAYLLLVPDRSFRTRTNRSLLVIGVYFYLFAVIYLAVVEYYFFQEFTSRLNLVAVDHLVYPHEVLVNIWESYPVILVMVTVAVLSAMLLSLLWPAIRSVLATTSVFRERIPTFTCHVFLLLLAVVGFATDTLARSDNRVANEIAANGVSSFFESLLTSELDYDAHYRTRPPGEMYRLLTDELGSGGGEFTHLSDGGIERRFAADPGGLGKLNVVVIVEESFGARYIGAYGEHRMLTPEFDALARQGLLFSNVYATGTRTVRGLEAITTSFPPIPSESILKRPRSEHIANWGAVMRSHGYHTSFLYGGYGYFDNMNHFFISNGFHVSDRADIADPIFANIWGVSDEDLFRHAIAYFDDLHEKGAPFFSVVMTTSNHKPFTFREGVPGVPPRYGGRGAGIRYADYALGEFFRQARGCLWYGDTVFVILADHGARVYGRAQIPLYSYEIPLLILGPGHIAPGVVDALTSQIDVAPTVLGLLGLPYQAPFFGQNVLSPKEGPRTVLLNHNHDVAVYREDELAVLGLHGKAVSYRYDKKHHSLTPIPSHAQLIDLATAYYQVAYELFETHRYR